MLHFVDEDSNLPSSIQNPSVATRTSDEPIVPEIPVTSEATTLQGIGEGVGAISSSSQAGISTLPYETPSFSRHVHEETSPPHLVRKPRLPRPHLAIGSVEMIHPGMEKAGELKTAPSVGAASLEKTGVQSPPPASLASKTAKLPELFEKFGQLETRLKSSKHSSPSGFPEQKRVFQEWARKDFSASFSLKALHDLKKVTSEFFKADQLSKTQHDSFFSFFENLRVLRDQYKRAERQANRVRCFQEKELSTSAQVDKLMNDGSLTKERIGVVTAEIQKLEEQLVVLKAEQATLLDTLENQIEEVKKINSELEHSRSQLANSHTVLAEPNRIFTIMQTYHS
ncbi:uncharacterized protein LOC126621788 isoform X2 [Malus sylvestris]|uniref:uncharacterized protein LOC126621788 isoform X2 n=1 Tax=Malus sylvestris TaxID=3752 RepID=UPI0021AC1339|nr:uncharacterized protein LOC126621788 isoform X2 [Malus sylvestris]